MARDYTSIITTEWSSGSAPKFQAMIAALGEIFGANYDVMVNAYQSFDLDLAVGVQLDQIGLWVGCSRRVEVPLNIFFSLDTAGLGFDQGQWLGPYTPPTGLTLLDDETYRTVLRGVIAFNRWDGSTEQYNAIMNNEVFAGTGSTFKLHDNQNMTMTVTVTGAEVPAVLQAELTTGRLHIQPAGVTITGYTFP